MSGRGGAGWKGGKPFRTMSTVWRDGPLELPEQRWVPTGPRPAPPPKEPEDAAALRVLELWQELVGFELGEARRWAFLHRIEVRWLARHPNDLLEPVARSVMATSTSGDLLLAEWSAAVFAHTGEQRPG